MVPLDMTLLLRGAMTVCMMLLLLMRLLTSVRNYLFDAVGALFGRYNHEESEAVQFVSHRYCGYVGYAAM